MAKYSLLPIHTEDAYRNIFALEIDGKCSYLTFLEDSRARFNIGQRNQFNLNDDSHDEVMELEQIIEDYAYNNPILKNRVTKVKKSMPFSTIEIKTPKMIRVYCIVIKGTGNIIITGHIKGNKKDQNRVLNNVKKISKQYKASIK